VYAATGAAVEGDVTLCAYAAVKMQEVYCTKAAHAQRAACVACCCNTGNKKMYIGKYCGGSKKVVVVVVVL
jgi:hypothetical protein